MSVYEHGQAAQRLPEWLRRPLACTGEYRTVAELLNEMHLATVCQEAKCPNRGECYARGTATFLVAGDTCTRACSFCAVESRPPQSLDPDEPARVGEAVAHLGLKHAVITMVTRDDLTDGAAGHMAATIAAVRAASPDTCVEVLVSDFGGSVRAVETVMQSAPDVFNHNVETVPRLYAVVRPQASYERSLAVLAYAKTYAAEHRLHIPVKSGLMLGLGETHEEVLSVMRDLRGAGCELLTLGQYLRPSAQHLPVAAFVDPQEFSSFVREGRDMGFLGIASGPFVRSSYRASELVACVPPVD